MNYEERDEYVQQKANEYCKKEKERGTLMKISGVEPLVYKAYKNGYYESEKENKQLKQQITKAKENGVVWHDLRKSPNDLPKSQNEVLCLLWEDSYYIGYYHINSKMWCFDEFSLSEDENEDEVTAWCELPKFEVEG